MTMLGLKNIRVLITGGASEIGAATAERFLKEEARVLVLDRDEIACKKIYVCASAFLDVEDCCGKNYRNKEGSSYYTI